MRMLASSSLERSRETQTMSGKGAYRYKDTRKLLDQLLGEDRNGENDATMRKSYSDEVFCRAFLCGMCPNEMFLNTKNDLGDCPRRHNERKRRDYEEAVASGQEPGYDQELYWTLRRVVDDCNRRVQRGQQRLLETQGPEDEDAISVQIKDMMARVEELGEAGDVDASVALLEEVKAIKEAKFRDEKLRKAAEAPGDNAQSQRLRVCESCASFLSLSDNEKRLSDHYTGKLHQSFVIIRRKVEQLEKDRHKWQPQQRFGNGGPGGGGPGGGHFGGPPQFQSHHPQQQQYHFQQQQHQQQSHYGGGRGGGGGGGGGFLGGGGPPRRDYDRARNERRDYDRSRDGPRDYGSRESGERRDTNDSRERRRSRSPRREHNG